jgi:hypothetical protein
LDGWQCYRVLPDANLKTTNEMKDVNIKMPTPSPIVEDDTGVVPVTHCTRRTGAVFNCFETANVAPVSSTLLVKAITTPEIIEYLIKDIVTFLNTVRGFPPKVRATSSSSIGTRWSAEIIERTK